MSVYFGSCFYQEQQALWHEFKQSFDPELQKLTVQDNERRFDNFVGNLKLVDARNTQEDEPVHGITKFSSLSQAEFEKHYLLDAFPEPSSHLAKVIDSPVYKPGLDKATYNTPAGDGAISKDWSGLLTTPVRDQGHCASGWAFAAASQLESDAQRVLGIRYLVSPQQMIACDEMSNYCSGGWPETAYDYIRRTGGIEREASYPYVSNTGNEPSCRAVVDDYVISLKSSPSMISRESNAATENAMAYHVNSEGPLTVCVDATKWNSYVGGVVTTCGGDINHCLQVVGVHVNDAGEGFWRLRNSWGSDWGEGGHIRLKFGKDTCAITHRPTFTTPDYADSVLRQAQD